MLDVAVLPENAPQPEYAAPTVWEPTLAEIHATVGDWVGYAAAIAERRYTEREARKLIMATGNWGCWHDTKGRTNNA